MSECGKIRESFSDYIDGLLPAGRAAGLERHLEDCPECAHELEAMKEMIEVMSAMEQVDPPAGFLSRVNSRLEEKESFSERTGRIFRKIFLPLRFKLPIELAGVAAAVLLIAWMSGNLGREGLQQLAPGGTGTPNVLEVDGVPVEETLEQPAAPEGSGGTDRSGSPAREKKAKGRAESAVEKGTVVEKESVVEKEPAGAGETVAKEEIVTLPVDDVAEDIGDLRKDVDAVFANTEAVLDDRLIEADLLESVAALVDSAGGRIIASPAGEKSWNEVQTSPMFARKVSAVRASRTYDTEESKAREPKLGNPGTEKDGTGARDVGADLEPPKTIFVIIHRSVADRFLDVLESRRPDYMISAETRDVSSDSLLIRMDLRRLR